MELTRRQTLGGIAGVGAGLTGVGIVSAAKGKTKTGETTLMYPDSNFQVRHGNRFWDLGRVRVDTLGAADPGSNRMIVPADGIYQVYGQVTYGDDSDWETGDDMGFWVEPDVALVQDSKAGTDEGVAVMGATALELLQGDHVKGWVYQHSGSDKTVVGNIDSTYLGITYLSDLP